MTSTILDMIGDTPLIEIRHLNPNPQVRMLAKLEYLNPGGSIKDRPALSMITAGEASGELTPDKIVLEATSGNTGIGLAMVCSVKGYRLQLAMSEAASVERQKILKARGAEILLTPGHLGTDGAIEEVYRLAREYPDRYFMTDQYNNPANWRAHYETTAAEIWAQTGGQVDVLVATLGTSGTLMGLSRRLKELNPRVRIVGAEPFLGHKLQGLKNMKEAYRPEIFDKDRLDAKPNVDDEEAFEMTRRLAREEGLFVGMSSGAAMVTAVAEARRMDPGVLVVVLPDGGERYLSTSVFDVREPVKLRLFNTRSRRKEAFETLKPGKVGMYTCGPTAHAPLQIGEGRRFIFADLLHRYLEYRGYAVRHIMNITDLDDKTIQGSEAAGQALTAFTDAQIEGIKADLAALRIKPADDYPRSSQHQDAMVKMADQLVRKGYAYEKLRSLYFNISRAKDYGQFSGIDLDKIRLGATVDLDEYEKDNPRDFTLLKRARLSELKRGIYTKTDWGNVRPSWHLQCTAMAMHHLGRRYDIHTAGRELLFPHHENSIAIATAVSGHAAANLWVHCDRVLLDGKSVHERTNALTVRGLLESGWEGRVLRFWLLGSHYRKAVIFSNERLTQARAALRRLDTAVRELMDHHGGEPYAELDQLRYDIKQGFTNAMDDDLNISAALAAIFKNIRKVNQLRQTGRIDAAGAGQVVETLRQIDTVLQVFDFDLPEHPPTVQALLDERAAARSRGDWATADAMRDRLLEMGVRVRDSHVD
ncbi:MAG: cysteine synthase [Desulfosarcinaceae bacterium]|nr:cysteine synthase [Desulfosarcinaceae bacterium]